MCEESLYKFLEHAWPAFDPAPFVGGWHLGAIAEHLEAVNTGQIKRLLINIRPRSTKTILVSVVWQVWTWLLPPEEGNPLIGPGVRFLCASYGAGKAQEDAVTARRLIRSEWFQNLWGDRVEIAQDRDNQERFDTTAGGSRISTGVPESLGKGGMIKIIDDPQKTDEAESEKIAEQVVKNYKEIWQTRSNDPQNSVEVMVMQRQAEGDLSGYWLENFADDVVHLCIPAWYEDDRKCQTFIDQKTANIYTKPPKGAPISLFWEDPRTIDGESFWPQRYFPRDRTKDEKLGDFAFSGQIQQRPSPRGGGIIKRMWWQVWPPDDAIEQWTAPTGQAVYPDWELQVAYLDTAFTKDKKNDYSAMARFGVFGNAVGTPSAMLCGAWQDRHDFSELIRRVKRSVELWKTDLLIIENKAGGVWVRDELLTQLDAGQVQIVLDTPTIDKVARAHAVVPLFQGKLVYAPFMHDAGVWRSWAEMVISNVEKFPTGRHDDIVDCVTGALGYLRRNKLIMFKQEHDEEEEDARRFKGRTETIAQIYGVA